MALDDQIDSGDGTKEHAGLTIHHHSTSFAAFPHESVPKVVALGCTLGQRAVAGLIFVFEDVAAAGNLLMHTMTECHPSEKRLSCAPILHVD